MAASLKILGVSIRPQFRCLRCCRTLGERANLLARRATALYAGWQLIDDPNDLMAELEVA